MAIQRHAGGARAITGGEIPHTAEAYRGEKEPDNSERADRAPASPPPRDVAWCLARSLLDAQP